MSAVQLQARTVPDVLAARAAARPEAPFVHFEGADVSYRTIDDHASRAAAGFAALGIGRGDRVCVALANGVDYLVAWFGLVRLGAVVVPISPEYSDTQIAYMIGDSGASAMVTSTEFQSERGALLEQSKNLTTFVYAGEMVSSDDGAAAPRVMLRALVRNNSPIDPLPMLSPADPVAIIYTSGTTGSPKGVLLCHEHELTLAENVAASIELGEADCFYNFFPLHHNTGLGIITLAVLVSGARMLLTDRFSRSRFWSDVKGHGCTVFYGMGAIIEMLNKDPGGASASQGHTLRQGWGIAIGEAQASRFKERFGVTFVTGYGSTEVNMVAISKPEGGRPGAAGVVLGDTFEVAIVDDSDSPVPRGSVGEIVVRPRRPFVTALGYWGKPAETVTAWRNLWLHTGDAGRLEDDGSLYFVDRLKDVIRHRGNNVSSAEVEAVILVLDEVDEVAVVPAPSDLAEFDEDVRVVLVASSGSSIDPRTIVEHCVQELPKFAVPRYVDVVDALPKTETGKVKKRELRSAGGSFGWDREAEHAAERNLRPKATS